MVTARALARRLAAAAAFAIVTPCAMVAQETEALIVDATTTAIQGHRDASSRQVAADRQPDLDSLAGSLVATGAPGAGVMLVSDGSVSIGVAGVRALGDELLIRHGDHWHLGSNTKAMTAVLAARLVEAGLVSWDDTVAGHLAAVLDGFRAEYADLTFAELFRHTSGLPANAEYTTMLQLMGHDHARDAEADRVAYAQQVLTAEPGGEQGEFLYSNAGYVVAGAMIEVATGESWETLMTRFVFEPLGIASGGFGPPGRIAGADQQSQPSGHLTSSDGELMSVPPGMVADNPPALGPAGRAHMSLDDYARFLTVVMRGARGEEDEFLGRASWDRLLTPAEGQDYAMGWGIQPVEATGANALRHAGSNTMWLVQAVLWPYADRAAVLAVNEARLDRLREPMDAAIEALSPKAGGSE